MLKMNNSTTNAIVKILIRIESMSWELLPKSNNFSAAAAIIALPITCIADVVILYLYAGVEALILSSSTIRSVCAGLSAHPKNRG
jgi:hypothetical protein